MLLPAFRQHIFFLRRKDRKLANFRQIVVHRYVGAKRGDRRKAFSNSHDLKSPRGHWWRPSVFHTRRLVNRSEEHTSELQSLMRISYAVFCLKTKNTIHCERTIQ